MVYPTKRVLWVEILLKDTDKTVEETRMIELGNAFNSVYGMKEQLDSKSEAFKLNKEEVNKKFNKMLDDLQKNDWKRWVQITEDYGTKDNPNPYQVFWHWDEGKVIYEILASTKLKREDAMKYTEGILHYACGYHYDCTMRATHKFYFDHGWHFYELLPTQEGHDKLFDDCLKTFVCRDEDWSKIMDFVKNPPAVPASNRWTRWETKEIRRI